MNNFTYSDELYHYAFLMTKYIHGTYLIHHGIDGQKWGVRRYQNKDGTLTEAGKKREAREYRKELNRNSKIKSVSVARYRGLKDQKVQRLEKKIR